MANARNLSTLAQGASTAGILDGAYGGTSLSSVGSAGNVLFTTNGTTWSSTAKIVRASAVTLTSQTSVDFTSIPSWVKRITIMLNAVSTASTGSVLFQIGTGGTPTASGYTSVITNAFSPNSVNAASSTAGFLLGGAVATYNYNGNIFITNLTGNIWCCSGLICNTVSIAYTGQMAGSVTLSGTLNILRMTTTAGTDTFDAGSVNILYE